MIARFLVLPIALVAASTVLSPCEEPVEPADSCLVTGCSGQVCAPEPVATTCEWTCEYGCYVNAVCETQAAGVCGWTSTPEFEACLDACAGQGF